MKKILAMLLCLMLLLGAMPVMALADEAPITIRFAYNAFDAAITAWTACIDEANALLKAQGKNIVIEGVQLPVTDWNDYYTKVTTQIAAGTGPDIGLIAESFMPLCIDKGIALDITQYMDRINMDDYFAATFQNAAYQNERYYGLPGSLYFMLMYVNKDLYDEAGLAYPSGDWNNANSFQTVLDDCAVLSGGEGAMKHYGISAGPYMGFIGMYTLNNGGDNIFDAEGKVALTSPKSLEVYNWFDEMLNNRYIPRPSDTQVISAFDMFTTGRIAMLIDGSWSLAALYDYDDLNVTLAAIPSNIGNASSSMFVDSFLVFKGTKNEEAAFDALNAMISQEGWNALAQTAFGGIPVNRAAFEANKDKFLPMGMDTKDLEVLIGGMEHAVKMPYNQYYQQADYEANLAMDEWLLGSITAEEYAQKVTDILQKYQDEADAK